MKFHKILTHEYPDLDAMLCCYLLKTYGEKQYPGISNADLSFCPAGRLPNNKTPEELEKEGVLPVDIGGGRLDTHPNGNYINPDKMELSAANLVAQELEIENLPSLKFLLEFTRLQDSKGQSLRSSDPIDHIVALPNLIKGGLLYFQKDFKSMTNFFIEVFGAIERAEKDEKYFFPVDYKDYLIQIHKDEVYFKEEDINLKTLFALYISKKYSNKKINKITEDNIKDKTIIKDLESFIEQNKLNDYFELEKLINFLRKIKPNTYLLGSTLPTDKTVSLLNIIKGFYLKYKNNIDKFLEKVFILFECIVKYEINWKEAIEEYNNKKRVYEVGNLKIVAIEAERGVVSKVARWQDKADLIIFKDKNEEHISISVNKVGKLKNYTLRRLAAKLRVAENIYKKGAYKIDKTEDYFEIGERGGWFLHQSQKLLVHGSPKAKRDPSPLSFDLIIDLVINEFSKEEKLPKFCPSNKCYYKKCDFYKLRLPNCFKHRERLRKKGEKEGNKDEKIKNKSEKEENKNEKEENK